MRGFYIILIGLAYNVLFAQQYASAMDMQLKLEAIYHPQNFVNAARLFNANAQPAALNSGSKMQQTSSSPILSANWQRLTGSMDIFGNLYSHTKPLSFEHITNTFTFFHRKSETYTATPASNKGTLVAMIGANNGTSWDSSCVFTSSTSPSFISQGCLYNPPGNNSYNNTRVVALGAVKSGSLLNGSFFASKSVTATNKFSPGNDVQLFQAANNYTSAASPNMRKHSMPVSSLENKNTGIFTLAQLVNDENETSAAARGLRGFAVIKGYFNAGVFNWTIDSLKPPVVQKSDGSFQLWEQAYLAMNESGQVGYAVLIGSRQGSSGSNIGWQPLIYKTTNGGFTWVLVNPFDFNQPTLTNVLNGLHPVENNPTLKVPFFNPAEGIDVKVDWSNRLHLMTTVASTAKTHNDSLAYIRQFLRGTNVYTWEYENTKWPYIYDFITDGNSAPTVLLVDSVGTEIAGNLPWMPGFNSNPWANQTQSVGVSSGMRLQMSSDYCGGSMLYSWAESDTNNTNSNFKYNEFPNLKVRAYRHCDNKVSLDEYDITGTASGGAANRVKDKAYFHSMSNGMIQGAGTATSYSASCSYVVSNNLITDGSDPINHYFTNANIQFTFPSAACSGYPFGNVLYCSSTAINEVNSLNNFIKLQPNPAQDKFTIVSELILKDVKIFDMSGKLLLHRETGHLQELELNTEPLQNGVYVLQVMSQDNRMSTYKLVVSK
jgi:hypothetical protein